MPARIWHGQTPIFRSRSQSSFSPPRSPGVEQGAAARSGAGVRMGGPVRTAPSQPPGAPGLVFGPAQSLPGTAAPSLGSLAAPAPCPEPPPRPKPPPPTDGAAPGRPGSLSRSLAFVTGRADADRVGGIGPDHGRGLRPGPRSPSLAGPRRPRVGADGGSPDPRPWAGALAPRFRSGKEDLRWEKGAGSPRAPETDFLQQTQPRFRPNVRADPPHPDPPGRPQVPEGGLRRGIGRHGGRPEEIQPPRKGQGHVPEPVHAPAPI